MARVGAERDERLKRSRRLFPVEKSIKAKRWLWLVARRSARSDRSRCGVWNQQCFRRGSDGVEAERTRGVQWKKTAINGWASSSLGLRKMFGFVGNGA